MERLKIIEHRGQQVVLLDFTNATNPDETVREIAEAKAWFARQTPNQMLRT